MVAMRLGLCCVDVGYLGFCRSDWIVFPDTRFRVLDPACSVLADWKVPPRAAAGAAYRTQLCRIAPRIAPLVAALGASVAR